MNQQTLYITKGGSVSGPFTKGEVLRMLEVKEISVTTLLSEGENSEWITLASFAPDETIEVIARRERLLSLKRIRLATILCVVFVSASVAMALLNISNSNQFFEKDTNNERAIGKMQELLKEKSAEVVKAKKSMSEAVDAAASSSADHDRLSAQIEGLASNLVDKDHRIEILEGIARDYASDFANYKMAVFNVAQIPEKAILEVNVSNDGPLLFDADEVEAIIENELGRAGFIMVETSEPDDSKIYVYASISQLKISDGYQSVFKYSLSCFAKCLRGEKIRAFPIFEEETFGYAGSKSSYKTTAKEFFSGAVVKCVAKINEARAASDGTKEIGEVFDPLLKAGVSLSKKEKGDSMEAIGSASGVVIGSRPLILTNHHVISKGRTIRLHFNSGPSFDGVVLAFSESDDLAVLTTKEQNKLFQGKVFAPFCESSDVSIGGEVYSLGFPMTPVLGKELKYSSGSISSIKGMRDQIAQFQHSIPTQPGNSGGPVFFKSGELAGLVVSTLDSIQTASVLSAIPQNVNYAIHVNTILEFLESNRLLDEVRDEKREPLKLEEAKTQVVRIEIFE